MKNEGLKVKLVRGLIVGATTLIGGLIASCVRQKDDPIEAGAGEIDGEFVEVPEEETVSTEEVTEG